MPNQGYQPAEMPAWLARLPAVTATIKQGIPGPNMNPLPLYLGFENDYVEMLSLRVKYEEVVIATGVANSSTADTSFLPQHSYLLCVKYWVQVTPGGSPTMSIGEATNTARFLAAGASSAAGQNGILYPQLNPTNTDALGPRQTANQALRFTFASNPSNALGRIRVALGYIYFGEPLVSKRT